MRRPGLLVVLVLVAIVSAGCAQEADPDDAAFSVTTVEGADPPSEEDGPLAYGDDPRLDVMQDDCEDGEVLACDLLFLESIEGSDYEEVALTCGGRNEDTGTFCSPHPEIDESGFAPEDSEGLPQLAEQCKDGDLTACDVLYLIVPEGHALEEVGYTCGGRAEDGVYPDCRTELG